MKPFFDDGRIKLYCGDCREVSPYIEKADAIITDPPYGISFAAQPTKWQRKAGMLAETWDDETQEFPNLDAGKIVVWGGNYFVLPPSRGWLIWHKPDAPPSMANAEMAWTNQDKNTRLITHSISATNKERVGHPTQKPVRVMEWTLQQVAVEKDAHVVDFYMGSGTTAIACIRQGMRFTGIERDLEHFETALDRIKKELSLPPSLF